MFLTPHGVHRLRDVSHHVKAVEDDLLLPARHPVADIKRRNRQCRPRRHGFLGLRVLVGEPRFFGPKPGRPWLTGAAIEHPRRRLPACLAWTRAYGLPHIAAPFSGATPDCKQNNMVQPHGGQARPALYGGRDSLRVLPAIAPHRSAVSPPPAAASSPHPLSRQPLATRPLADGAPTRRPPPHPARHGPGPPDRAFPSKARKTAPSKAPGAPQVRPPATPSNAPGRPGRLSTGWTAGSEN